MKRSNKIITLSVVLVAACAVTFGVSRYEKKQEEIKNSDEVILNIGEEEVSAVSWKIDGAELAFHKSEDQWYYDEDDAFPVSTDKMSELLSHFESFGVSFVIENVEDYAQYGLDDSENEILLTTEDKSYEIKLGDYSKMDEQRYIDIGDGNVYLVSEDPLDYLETELSAMILNDKLPNLETVTKIQFSGDQDYEITYEEESTDSYSEDDTYYTKKDGKNVPLDPDKIQTYLNTVAGLNLETYVTYNATEEELESYGLDQPELSVTIDYSYMDEENETVSDTFVLHIGLNQEELDAAEEAEEAGKDTIPDVTKYVRIGDSQIVYKLTDTAYDTLIAASYDDLRHDEVLWADTDTITQIDVTLEGTEHSLTSEMEDDTRVWYYDGEEIDVASLKSALSALKADSFTDREADQKEEISLTVYLDNENYPQIEIDLYRYDGSLCQAVVNGESVSLVERSQVVDLIEAVQTIVLK